MKSKVLYISSDIEGVFLRDRLLSILIQVIETEKAFTILIKSDKIIMNSISYRFKLEKMIVLFRVEGHPGTILRCVAVPEYCDKTRVITKMSTSEIEIQIAKKEANNGRL